MKSIVLLGAGGHGRVVAEIAELNGFGKIGKLGKLIHPSSEVSSYANILPETVVMANAVINSYSTVEANVIVNTS